MLRGLILICLLFSGIDKNFAQPKSKKDSVVDFAGTLLGTKYTFGMQDPVNGFDCSGFVHYVFNRFTVPLPRASMDYERIGHKIMIDSVQPGDILVFTGTNAAIRHPGHVGIVNKIENKEIYFIHSSSSSNHKGVVITNFSKVVGYQKRFLWAVRLSALE